MITFNKENKQLIIADNYKGRLQSARIMSIFIFIMSVLKLLLVDWKTPKEMDYVFCIIAAVFLYFVYKNFLKKTAISTIDKAAIKFVKMPKGLATKAEIYLNNGKVREVFGLKNIDYQNSIRKTLSDAKITVH